MRPIRSRNDLLELAAKAAPTRACQRAIREGRAQVLGGFKPAEGLPYWVVRAWSNLLDKNWFIAIICDEDKRRYRFRYPERVEWADWVGHPEPRVWSPYCGDDPKQYAYWKEQALNQKGDHTWMYQSS